MKPEHGGKLQLRCQTSTGRGLQQAGSSHTAQPFFFLVAGGGGIPPTMAFTTLSSSPSATGTARAAAQPEQ